MYFSQYMLLVLVPMIFGLWAQHRVNAAFGKYSKVRAASNLTGAQVAQEILGAAQIHDVEVVQVDGYLGDHYDPSTKRLCLSTSTFGTPSVAAVGIAAHETGHAIQHARAYAPLQARMAVVPATQIASQVLPVLLIGSLFIPLIPFAFAAKIAVVCYLILTVFQLITLPVEFDASRRAKLILQNMSIIQAGPETSGVNEVLNAAALTYVAAFVASLGSLLYWLTISSRRN